MLSQTQTLLLLLPALGALAAPAPSLDTTNLSTSKTVKLVANVLTSDSTLSVQDYELNPFSTSTTDATCTNALGLSPPTYGGLWHLDASTLFNVASGPGWAQRLGAVVQPGGTATVPASRAVEVSCGAGTDGISVVQKDDGTPVLRYGKAESGWMACPAAVLNVDVPADDGAVLVAYRDAGQRVLAGCASVEFVAVCSGETDGGEPSAVEVPCVVQQ